MRKETSIQQYARRKNFEYYTPYKNLIDGKFSTISQQNEDIVNIRRCNNMFPVIYMKTLENSTFPSKYFFS